MGIKMITGFILSKIIAIFAGPSGIALVGQLANVISISTLASSGGIASGIVKYTAEDAKDEKRTKKIVSTALLLMIAFSLTTAIIIVVLSKWLAARLLGNSDLQIVFIVLAITLPFSALATLIMSVINGKRDISRYVRIGIIANVTAFVIAIPLVAYFKSTGALIASTLNVIPLFVYSFLYAQGKAWYREAIWRPRIDSESLRRLMAYTMMAASSTLVIPLGQLIVRNYLISHYSIEWAGYWQAIVKISDYYLVFITSSLGIYYLPRLSELKNAGDIRKEVVSAAKIVLPILIVGQIFLYLLRSIIITLLYTKDFLVLSQYMPFQLIGDFFKIASWLMASIMIAKAKTLLFIGTEIVFGAGYVLLVIFFLKPLGISSVFIAYSIEYLAYFLLMVFLFFNGLLDRNAIPSPKQRIGT